MAIHVVSAFISNFETKNTLSSCSVPDLKLLITDLDPQIENHEFWIGSADPDPDQKLIISDPDPLNK